MNIEISFKNKSKLIVRSLQETNEYDYLLEFHQENLYPDLDGDCYSPCVLNKPMCDVQYNRNCIALYYIDKYDDMDNLNEILDVFNLSDKTATTLFNYNTQDYIEKTIDDIPELKKSNIEDIRFLDLCKEF